MVDSNRDYAKEKMLIAVQHLATSPLSLQERLYNAYLSFHTLQPPISHRTSNQMSVGYWRR